VLHKMYKVIWNPSTWSLNSIAPRSHGVFSYSQLFLQGQWLSFSYSSFAQLIHVFLPWCFFLEKRCWRHSWFNMSLWLKCHGFSLSLQFQVLLIRDAIGIILMSRCSISWIKEMANRKWKGHNTKQPQKPKPRCSIMISKITKC
jgi:hypothetical protein